MKVRKANVDSIATTFFGAARHANPLSAASGRAVEMQVGEAPPESEAPSCPFSIWLVAAMVSHPEGVKTTLSD